MENSFDILFLGTCACDFSPKLNAEYRDRFDYDARRSSSILINGSILVDCGTHTLNSLDICGIPYKDITDLFITHLHSDHFDIGNISRLAEGREKPLRLWVRDNAIFDEISNVEIVKMTTCVNYSLKEGLNVTGLLANHDEDAYPQHFLFEVNGKKLFYGCDGAWLLNSTYYYLRNARLDIAILDCTSGDYMGDYRMAEHNSIPMIRVMLPSLKSFGVITDNTRIYFSHLAPSLHKPHIEAVEIAKEMGANVAYDGLRIKL